ncbi:hypothetical protein [Sporomusa acidovorans]|uniref:Uncharacterized protein n=1 Tax=Sporomusa acidovorans (strain ATCC 49682 / DSM 3132 / Mol) TaxID=1123286 RepID=A0ABZ3J962_SPOA4|nr:hypothetical protein [Sporomusa acidovorans]OZC15995.1 hypothetical protein SPACI_43610 [Sporomusa acidovorans DSM 3132]SDD90451.1 hypothetical protein SAMN04488499_1005136 [Sporomusa acidovorans]
MRTAKIMFLWPTSENDLVGKIIQSVEGPDQPTHVAVVLEDSLLEATSIGVRQTDRNRHINRRREIIEIKVPHPECANVATAMLLGRGYSYFSCLMGYFRKKGIKFPFNSPYDDCSEVGTLFLRSQGLNVFGWDNPAGIRPDELRQELLRLGGKVIEQWP